MSEADQVAALARLHGLLDGLGIDYWLFGGWAVDLHAGSVTRPHDDLDIAVWLDDRDRVASLLADEGWTDTPDEDDDGFTAFERGSVRIELAFLARDEHGQVFTPLRDGRGSWPDGAFGDDMGEAGGVRARIVSLAALRADKSEAHDDPKVTAKDRADLVTLSRLS